MSAVFFYHLTRRPLDVVLAELLGKSLERGWRVAVRGGSRDRLEWLDEKLWLEPKDGFLPHGLAGGPQDAHQPILLTTAPEAPNGATCLLAVDGAEIAATEVAALTRACILFDGQDEAAVSHARAQWKTLTGAGCKAQYWSEESGRWEMKAEA